MASPPPDRKPAPAQGAPAALESPGLRGRPVEILPLPFKLGLTERVRALAGAPSWVRRARRLERRQEALEAELELAWRRSDPVRWPQQAGAWDLAAMNAEIDAYNAMFPIERNLPMDPASRDFSWDGRPWRPRPRLDVAWILARFPAAGAGMPCPPGSPGSL